MRLHNFFASVLCSVVARWWINMQDNEIDAQGEHELRILGGGCDATREPHEHQMHASGCLVVLRI